MGIYNRYLTETNETLDSVQDPDNIGIDLDQVEKDIAGNDGIEAHSEEIDDAVEGEIGDPVEEAYMIMYESEYNYNKLLEAIGMRELSEAVRGREFVLEAVDIKSFFGKIKKFIVDMFSRITKAFKNALGKLHSMVMNDRKFEAKYGNKITQGEKEYKGEKIDIYKFDKPLEFKSSGNENNSKAGFDHALDLMESGTFRMEDFTEDKNANWSNKNTIKVFTGLDTDGNIGELSKLLTDYYFGEKDKAPGSSFSANVIRGILSSDKEVKSLNSAYDTIKKSYKQALANLDSAEKAAMKAESTETGRNHISMIANWYAQRIRFEQNIRNIQNTVLIKAASAKRKQARKLASVYIKAAGGYANESAHINTSRNSSDGIFSNVKFM